MGFVQLIVGMIIYLGATFLNAWMAGYIFSWVLTPTYGIPAPSFWHLVVFFMVWVAIRMRYNKQTEDMEWEDAIKYSIISIISSLMFFGLAALMAATVL
jgi:hypothetical protein